MRTLIRLAAHLYPKAWRYRYGDEFDALLEDISPSWRDLVNVLGLALAMRGRLLIDRGFIAPALALGTVQIRLPVAISLATHVTIVCFAMLLSLSRLDSLHLPIAAGPLPPPAPDPLTGITDPRVFRDASTLYSSLPLRLPVNGSAILTRVVEGVGIYFPPLQFAHAARSALEGWEYRPAKFENRLIEVVSRVEVRFDGPLANAASQY